MRLVTYSRANATSIGVQLDSGVVDIPRALTLAGQSQTPPSTMIDLLGVRDGTQMVQESLSQLGKDGRLAEVTISADEARLLAPIPRPGKILALGLNYRDHIEETGREVPREPVVFVKLPTSVVGPDEDIPFPPLTHRLDWEVELGVVIGAPCKDVSASEALNYVAGYTVINDLSARDLQKNDGQWVRAKGMDGMCPMGPVIVTAPELGDGSGLRLLTRVNGEVKQDSNTSAMILDVPHIIEFLSAAFTLEPGDVIATGTPSGVGFARDPPEYLHPGDAVELHIERIGTLRNRIV